MIRTLVVGVFAFFALVSTGFGRDGPIEAHCARTTVNNADYRFCVAQQTGHQTRALAGRACGPSSCIYKLSCAGQDRVCSGKGVRVAYRSDETGASIAISLAGRVTTLHQCGTCSSQDYVSGPLKGTTIRNVGANAIVVEVPK